MLTALVIDDIGSLSAVLDKVQSLNEVGTIAEIIVVSKDEQPQCASPAIWVKGATLVDALHQAVSLAASKRVIVISSALQFESHDIARLVAEIETTPMLQHTIVHPHSDLGEIDLPQMSPDGIIASLTNFEQWPLLCVATTRVTLRELKESSASTYTELLAQALIVSMGDGDEIRVASSITPFISSPMSRAISELSPSARANLLRTTVEAMNIEELFPQHAWKEFSQESAAAAYHTLAALFLRFGDADAAIQSLQCSERLEESPRFFALLGLIQQSQGETLGAVANFVSSLQCYEARKKDDGKHYLSFKPMNLEVINSRLVDGLNALNKRDNDRALTHFSEAVFNFDSFYAQCGVQSPPKVR
jgi:hypothetical protein